MSCDLLPCPFCGGEARLEHNMTMADYWVRCAFCGAMPNGADTDQTEAEAIAVWNTRTVETCHNVDDHKTVWFICSGCGCSWHISEHINYCPNCGAKVVGE